ncbi:MAG: hypothetical protein WA941_05420 [Nitrososphaeraceae archaeon]
MKSSEILYDTESTVQEEKESSSCIMQKRRWTSSATAMGLLSL